MPVDISMYQKPADTNNDPLTQAVKMAELRNSVNKIRGGMPRTVASLDILGADAPFPVRNE